MSKKGTKMEYKNHPKWRHDAGNGEEWEELYYSGLFLMTRKIIEIYSEICVGKRSICGTGQVYFTPPPKEPHSLMTPVGSADLDAL